jgi:hypothetical protein
MNRTMRFGAAILAASTVSACATVTRGTHEKFEIVSQPPGADVSMTTGMTCVTPCHLKLRRKNGFIATITKSGYKPAQVSVESKMHGGGGAALAGNLIAGGIIGGVLDGTNGSLNDLLPNPINVTLTPEGSPGPIVTPGAAEPTPTPTPVPITAPKQ